MIKKALIFTILEVLIDIREIHPLKSGSLGYGCSEWQVIQSPNPDLFNYELGKNIYPSGCFRN